MESEESWLRGMFSNAATFAIGKLTEVSLE